MRRMRKDWVISLGASRAKTARKWQASARAKGGIITQCEKRMQGLTEKTILKMGIVRITNLRAIFGAKSYELSNITSASLHVQEPNLFLPIFFAVSMGICSVLVGISNLEAFGHWLQIGLYIAIAAILLFLISRKAKYRVQIKNPMSALTVLETHDGNFAESVVIAVNNAIADLDAHEQAQQSS